MGGPVNTEERDGVLIITLDRPTANAVDVSTSLALHAALRRLDDDPALRVGVLTATGSRFFCAGWDLRAAAAGEAVDADHGPGGFAGLTELAGRTTPVIAAVNGLALGGGFELVLAADLVVAADHVEFGLPEVRLGLVPDSGGLLRLPRRLPRAVALELLLSGRRLAATEALHWGLVNRVVPAADLLAAALALAAQIRHGAPLATAAVLEVVEATGAGSVEQGFRTMRSGALPHYSAVLGSADAQEGPRAFAEGRAAVWSGR